MWQLSILFPDGTRKVHSLIEPRTTIGRHEENAIQIPDEMVSGNHAEVIQTNGSLLLRDLNSSNGTYVEGAAVQEKELVGSCKVAFGPVECAFDLHDEADEPKATNEAELEKTTVPATRTEKSRRQQPGALTRAKQANQVHDASRIDKANEEKKLAQLTAEHEKRMEEMQAAYEQQLADAIAERAAILRKEDELRAKLSKADEEHKQAVAARESEHRERLQTIAQERDQLSATVANLQARIKSITADEQQAGQNAEELTARLKHAEAALQSRDAEQQELRRKLDQACGDKAQLEKECAALAKALGDAQREQQMHRQRVERDEREAAVAAKATPAAQPPAETGAQSVKTEDALGAAMQKIEALESASAVLRAEARRAQESAATDKQRLTAATVSMNERIAAADKEIAELREKLARKETESVREGSSDGASSRPVQAQERRFPKLLVATTAAACLAAGFAFGFATQAGLSGRTGAVPPRVAEQKPQAATSKKKESSKKTKPAVGLRPLDANSNHPNAAAAATPQSQSKM